MKIVFSKVKASDSCSFVTSEEEISVHILSNSGPELSFDDGSTVVFRNDRQHFRLMTDKEIYNNEEFDIKAFQKKYLKCVDRCYSAYAGKFIFMIEEYEVLGEPVYRFM